MQIEDVVDKASDELVADATAKATSFVEHEPLVREDGPELKKMQRVAGAKHMHAWDNSLKQCGLGGFKTFVAEDEVAECDINDLPLLLTPEELPPMIVFALDQGPQSYPTNFYMQYVMKMNVFCHYDVSHRLWNDCKDALAECGQWGFVILSIITMNLDFGPFDSCTFFARNQDALKHFVANCDCSHPLFQYFAEDIAKEAKVDIEDGEQWMRDVFDMLPGHPAWARKNQKVGLSRWFGWVDSGKQLLSNWSVRLLVLVWLSIISGYGCLSEHGWMLTYDEQGGSSGAAETTDDTRMSRSNAKVEALRSKCKNSVHLVCSWMADGYNRKRLSAFVALLAPLRKYHGSQNKEVRSADEAEEFFVAQAKGDGLLPLQATLEKLACASGLESLGFDTHFNRKLLGRPDYQADMKEEDEWCEVIINLTFCLVCHRILSLSHYMYSMPGCFLLALSKDASDHQELLRWVKQCHEGWEALLESGCDEMPHWKLVKERHVMTLQLVRRFVRQGLANDFAELDPVQIALARNLVKGFCQTKLIEDGVHCGSEQDQYKSRNGILAPRTLWKNLVHSNIMHQVHRYPEVHIDADSHLEVKNASSELTTKIFYPTAK